MAAAIFTIVDRDSHLGFSTLIEVASVANSISTTRPANDLQGSVRWHHHLADYDVIRPQAAKSHRLLLPGKGGTLRKRQRLSEC